MTSKWRQNIIIFPGSRSLWLQTILTSFWWHFDVIVTSFSLGTYISRIYATVIRQAQLYVYGNKDVNFNSFVVDKNEFFLLKCLYYFLKFIILKYCCLQLKQVLQVAQGMMSYRDRIWMERIVKFNFLEAVNEKIIILFFSFFHKESPVLSCTYYLAGPYT